MPYSVRLYLRDWWILAPLFSSLALQLAISVYTVSKIHATNEQIFLHYTIIFGVDAIGLWWKIFYPLIIGGIIFLINYTVSFFLYSSNKILARLLAVFTVLLELLLVVGAFLVIGLNI